MGARLVVVLAAVHESVVAQQQIPERTAMVSREPTRDDMGYRVPPFQCPFTRSDVATACHYPYCTNVTHTAFASVCHVKMVERHTASLDTVKIQGRATYDDALRIHLDETTAPIDPVRPAHYKQHPSGVECIDIIEHLSFNIGTAIKYLWRAGQKPGESVETELRKAVWYLEREITRAKKS